MIYCSKCTYPVVAVNISMNDKQVCSGCTVHDEKIKLDWNKREKKFKEILESYKSLKSSNSNVSKKIPITCYLVTRKGIKTQKTINFYLKNYEPVVNIKHRIIKRLKKIYPKMSHVFKYFKDNITSNDNLFDLRVILSKIYSLG